MAKKIRYNKETFTPCPFGESIGFGVFTVGDSMCWSCKHFVDGTNDEIECKHP